MFSRSLEDRAMRNTPSAPVYSVTLSFTRNTGAAKGEFPSESDPDRMTQRMRKINWSLSVKKMCLSFPLAHSLFFSVCLCLLWKLKSARLGYTNLNTLKPHSRTSNAPDIFIIIILYIFKSVSAFTQTQFFLFQPWCLCHASISKKLHIVLKNLWLTFSLCFTTG